MESPPALDDFQCYEIEQKRLSEKHHTLESDEQFNAFRFNLMSSASKVMREWREKLAEFIRLYQDNVLRAIEKERPGVFQYPEADLKDETGDEEEEIYSPADVYLLKHEDDESLDRDWVYEEIPLTMNLYEKLRQFKYLMARKMQSDIRNTASLETGPEGSDDFQTFGFS